MRMMDKLKRKFIPAFICILVFLNAVLVQAAEESSDNTNQILFVLDGSRSMAGDKWQEAVDVVEVVSAMLPSNYETAVIVYNDDIVTCTDLCVLSENQISELRSMVSKGYTNTGMALETALAHFSQEITGKKRIIAITDGEIIMKKPAQTIEAVELYETAVKRAVEQNVVIDVLMLGAEDFEDQISCASEETGGFIYKETETQSIEKFMETYLFELLGLESVVVGMSDAQSSALRISLQDACTKQAKILVLSESPIEDLNVNCQSENIQVFQAEKAAVIDLSWPVEDEIDLQYTTSEKGKIRAYLVKEYEFFVDMAAAYSSEVLGHVVEVHVVDAKGNAVFEDEDLKDKIDIYIDGNSSEYTVERGRAVIVRQIKENQEIQVQVVFKKLGGIVFRSGEEKTLYLELPPVEPAEPEEESNPYIWLYIVIAGICFAFALSMLLFLKAKKKQKNRQSRNCSKTISARCQNMIFRGYWSSMC